MVDERYVELMNKEIDGVNTPSESRELQAYLDGSSEAATLFDDLQQLATTLQGLEQQEPPSYLRNHILNSIDFAARGRATEPGWFERVIRTFQAPTFRRYSFVFVSGLCAGILFFILAYPWREDAADTSTLSGSMALFPDLPSLRFVDSIDLESEGIDGAFKTYRDGGSIVVEIEVKAPGEVRIELNSDPAELVFGSIGRLAGTEGEVNVTQGKITFSGINSDRSIVTFLDSGNARRPIEGRIYRDGAIVQSVTLRIR